MPSAVGRGKTRSSRISSPLPRNAVPEEAPSSSSEWVEPPVKAARPSYEEHGGSAFGVMEDMQGLGQPPNYKVRNRYKDNSLRKSMARGFKVAQEYGMAAEPSSTFDTPEPPALIPDLPSAGPPSGEQNGTADASANPRASRRSARSRRTRASSAASDNAKRSSPTPDATTLSLAPNVDGPDSMLQSQGNEASESEIERANFRTVVKIAEDRARELGYTAFGAALGQVYAESLENERYAHLLRAVLLQTDNEGDRADFTNAIKRAKKLLRTDAADDEDTTMTNGHHDARRPSSSPQSEPDAQPSIENIGRPRLRLTLNKKSNKGAGPKSDGARDGNERRSARIRRSSARSASPASSVSEEAEAVISAARADIDRATSTSDGGSARLNGRLDVNGSAAGNNHLKLPSRRDVAASEVSDVPRSESADFLLSPGMDYTMEDAKTNDRPPKRSPAVAGFDPTELRAIEEAKRRKFNDTLYKDPGPASQYDQSHVRESTEGSLINFDQPTIKLSNGFANGPSRRAREGSDSSLSAMSSTPPLEDSFAEIQALRSTKRAKTKQSPMKKQRPMNTIELDGKNANIDDDVLDEDESDHNDTCNACGGRGQLVCCDGCEKAYHYVCVDPPLTDDSPALEEAWYCPSCTARRKPPVRQPRGLFASLLQGLEKRNPSIFSLPVPLQRYYANVAIGKDGKFEDPNNVNAKTRNTRAGYDEPMDLLKTRDTKGQTIICYSCARSAEGRREIITCDVCANHWHLDCTNPPLVNPPYRDQYGRKTKDWICPLHVDHDLSAIDPMRLSQRRHVRIRRPKVAKIVDTALRRGLVNNGVIEIIDDTSSDEESEFEDDDDDDSASGIVYRVPSKGVKLDFIDKIHRARAAEYAQQVLPLPMATRVTARALQAELDSRAVLERHAALSLADLQGAPVSSGDAVQDLINTLTVAAPAEVISRVAEDERRAGDAKTLLSDARRKQLEELQELIRRQLQG